MENLHISVENGSSVNRSRSRSRSKSIEEDESIDNETNTQPTHSENSQSKQSSGVDWRDLPIEEQQRIYSDRKGNLRIMSIQTECDACPFCEDVCFVRNCQLCAAKLVRLASTISPRRKKSNNMYTMCQLRRHRTLTSAWVLIGNKIYDVTCELPIHPGGIVSILRFAGGEDCLEHYNFHPSAAKTMWKQCYIGTLIACQSDNLLTTHRIRKQATSDCTLS